MYIYVCVCGVVVRVLYIYIYIYIYIYDMWGEGSWRMEIRVKVCGVVLINLFFLPFLLIVCPLSPCLSLLVDASRSTVKWLFGGKQDRYRVQQKRQETQKPKRLDLTSKNSNPEKKPRLEKEHTEYTNNNDYEELIGQSLSLSLGLTLCVVVLRVSIKVFAYVH